MIKEYIKSILKELVDELVTQKMEERWEATYEHLIISGVETERTCRDEVRQFLEKAELKPLISTIRQEIKEIIIKSSTPKGMSGH